MKTAAQKRKFVKDLLKSIQEKTTAAIDSVPAEWDEIELREFIRVQLQTDEAAYALRGNTARGRAFTATLASI
jgi:hypothetical protein